MTRTTTARTDRKITHIDKKLRAAGADPLRTAEQQGAKTDRFEPAARSGQKEPTVDEKQVALSTWATEDAATGLSIISIVIAVVALVAAISRGNDARLSMLIGVLAVIAIGLGYVIASDRHAAAAAAAVIDFRSQCQSSASAEERPSSQKSGRRPLIEVRIDRTGR